MSLWTEIINTALIGCERKPLSLNGATGELGVLLGRLDQNDREGALLSAAALAPLYDRAATLPMKDTPPLPEGCEPDETSRCSVQAAAHLEKILRGEYEELLPELLAKVADAGLRAPEELAPLLLELGRTQEKLREALLPVLGERGRWLTEQNPSWSYAAARTGNGFDEKLWEMGNSAQRLAVLVELRKRNATRGRELLASNWAQESPKDRAGFLEALKYGLSLDDEAFLEAALDDRRKEVRGVAADLLAHLPGSALRRRMFERVRPLIKFKLDNLKRKTIEATLPEGCDEAMRRDGVVGVKTQCLQQMLSMIPLEVWPQESGWTISELVEAAKQCVWEYELLSGWSQAAKLCQDIEWADALLNEPSVHGKARTQFQTLPQTRQEAFIIKLLKADPVLNMSKAAYFYIGCCRRLWSETFSRAIIDSLLHTGTLNSLGYHSIWEDAKYTVGCHLDPALLPEAIARITDATKPPAQRAPEVEQFLNTIQFRYEMLNAF